MRPPITAVPILAAVCAGITLAQSGAGWSATSGVVGDSCHTAIPDTDVTVSDESKDMLRASRTGASVGFEPRPATMQVNRTAVPAGGSTKTGVSRVLNTQQMQDLPINGGCVASLVPLRWAAVPDGHSPILKELQ